MAINNLKVNFWVAVTGKDKATNAYSIDQK